MAIDNAHIVPLRALECRPGLGGLKQVYGSDCLFRVYVSSIDLSTFLPNVQLEISMIS